MVSESGADEAALFKSYSNLQDINPELAKQMLKEAMEIMEPLGVPFFLRQGTCLGAIRDQAFIPWDDDIDLGCVIGLNGLTEDMIDPVFDAFRNQGYFVNAESNDPLDCRRDDEVVVTYRPDLFSHHRRQHLPFPNDLDAYPSVFQPQGDRFHGW